MYQTEELGGPQRTRAEPNCAMQFFVRFEGKSHVLSSPTVETIDELFLAVEARVEIAMLLVRLK